jgi:hypothetical protein
MQHSIRDNAKTLARISIPVVLACLTSITAAASAQSTTSKVNPNLDQRAVDALRKMGAELRSLKSFAVSAETLQDEVLPDGESAQVNGTVNYVVRVPDRFRVDVRTDRKQRQIFYDGKTLTVWAPRMKYFASAPAPATIMATLDSASKTLGIEFPLADLFLWGTARDGVKELTSARYVGPAYIDGIDTDQYAFRQAGADWQIWIDRGNTPLPRKLVIKTTTSAARPQYVATLKYNLAPVMTDAMFAFTPPKDAGRIVFASLRTPSAK